MSQRHIFAVIASVIGTAAAFSGCTTILGDFEIAPATGADGGEDGGSASGRANGEGCQSPSDCVSGFCADGVCCDSACSGTCESCALADRGTCTPVPDGTDPAKECAPIPVSDGQDAAVPEAGTVLNAPDGGLVSNDALCAGTCNGARQCRFPGVETSCGSTFCNTSSEAARHTCDGKGRCALGLFACAAFACENHDCRTTCAAQDDCNTATHFCNPQGRCQQKLANGVACALPTDCQSGFCVGATDATGTSVCCNADCGQITGGSCTQSDSVGQCKCSTDCGAGSCRLFYRDADGDNFGDMFGTTTTNTAVIGCDNAPAPTGFVASHNDCADNDPDAYPGQSAFFANPIKGTSSFDFDCDGRERKESYEFDGASCTFCVKGTKGCQTTTTCTLGEQAYLSCAPAQTLCLPGSTNCLTCGGPPSAPYTEGFIERVACGGSATYTTCGTCGKLGLPIGTTVATQKTQRCN